MTTAQQFEMAMVHHRAGRLDLAERLYREILAQEPLHANAAFLLGGLALQSGRAEIAADLFRQATAVVPDNAAFHANLGEACRRLGRRDEALQAFLRALEIKPDLFEAIVNLGLWHKDEGDIVGALVLLERAADLKPQGTAVHSLLAAARAERDKLVAEGGLRSPSGRAKAAIDAVLDRASACVREGRTDEGLTLLRRALDLDPRNVRALNGLGVALTAAQRLDEAVEAFRRAIELSPDHADAQANLGNVLARTGLLDESLECHRRALSLAPNRSDIESNLLFLLPFHPRYGGLSIREEARAWNRRHAAALGHDWQRAGHDTSPGRRLRVGYVSADFRHHCQAFFTIPVLAHHDHAEIEVFCYSNVSAPDARTAQIRALAHHWRDIHRVTDEAAARRIRDDRIDILVDLTMHMAENRMLLFARKPAPIQACWLAYPGTTGLSAMDYRFTDRFLDPPESDLSVYVERSIHLPDAFWCYDPLTREPPVGALPARRKGHVTFGCLNNFAKLTSGVVALWARVLREVARSRLILLAPAGRSRARTLEAFAAHGVDPAAIEFVEYQPHDRYLATYQEIDVGLDTLPSNGHTTSLDALWMGVPVVTLVGDTVVGRAGFCQAMNLGLTDLVAWTPDEYVAIALRLAGDIERLSRLRAGLRERMAKSPLMDGARFARHLEAAYRAVWRRWCSGESPAPIEVAALNSPVG